MTQAEVITQLRQFADLNIEERISLSDIKSFFQFLDEEIRAVFPEESTTSLAAVFPEDFTFGEQVGMDYLKFVPANNTTGDPYELYFGVSWQNANWELIKNILVVEEFDLQFTLIGRSAQVMLHGLVEFEEHHLSLSLELPALFGSLELVQPNPQKPGSPVSLLERFQAMPVKKDDLTAAPGFKLDELLVLVHLRAKKLVLNLQFSGLKIGPVAITSQLQIHYTSGEISVLAWADFSFTAGGNNYTIGLQGAHDGPASGWQLEGGLAVDNLKLSALLDYFVHSFGIAGADELGFDTDAALKFIYLAVDTQSSNYVFKVELDMTDPFRAGLELTIDLAKKKETGKYDKTFSGKLTLGEGEDLREFDLVFSDKEIGTANAAGRKKQVLALYRKPGGEQIPLRKLLTALIDSPNDVPDLSFRIMDAMVVFLKEADGTKKYLFTSDMDFGLDLSGLGSLPLIGSALPKGLALKLNFQPIISPKDEAKKLSDEDLKDITAIIPADGPHLPASLQGGLALLTTISIGEFKKQIELGIGKDQVNNELGTTKTPAAASPAPTGPGNAPASAVPPPIGDDKIKWIELGKQFGPLHLGKVGVGFDAGKIEVRMDAGLSMGPVKFAVQGLGASYVLATKELHFKIDGVGLEIKSGPLEISGAFLLIDNQFIGKVNVRAEQFGFVALGAYGEFEGHPSLFLYAFVQTPPIGPAFFTVEGIAFGFGFNRRLIVPPIGEMYQFPLVSEARGVSKPPPGLNGRQADFVGALRQEFSILAKYIPPEVGQYFLVVGLKFSSFKTLESVALLVVNFGRRFDLAIIGITNLSVPNAKDNKVPKIAEVEMAFSVRFVPDEGFLAVEARLTPNSYIYSDLCKLRGGFAFYSWFKGPNEGDFVVTLGGYHHKFQPPKHYPQPADVPRLELNWRLSDHLYIKGEAYYALTPKAMMLGGRLEAHFDIQESLFDVNAWFIAKADFLMYWQPFHYEASISVEIGCEYTIYFLGTHKGSLSAGADLEIWGPEFAGYANVHAKIWGIKIDFTVDFGDTKAKRNRRISWADFKTAFLPESPDKKGIVISPVRGLVRTIKDPATGEEHLVFNPQELTLSVASLVPQSSKAAIYSGSKSLSETWEPTKISLASDLPAPAQLGVDPVGIAPDAYQCQTIFKLVYEETTITLSDVFHLHPVGKQFPKALWTDQLSPETQGQPAINGEQMVNGVAGYNMIPFQPVLPKETHAFPVKNLAFDQSGRSMAADAALAAKYQSSGTIAAPTAVQQTNNRRNILTALGFDPQEDHRLKPDISWAFIYSPTEVVFR